MTLHLSHRHRQNLLLNLRLKAQAVVKVHQSLHRKVLVYRQVHQRVLRSHLVNPLHKVHRVQNHLLSHLANHHQNLLLRALVCHQVPLNHLPSRLQSLLVQVHLVLKALARVPQSHLVYLLLVLNHPQNHLVKVIQRVQVKVHQNHRLNPHLVALVSLQVKVLVCLLQVVNHLRKVLQSHLV